MTTKTLTVKTDDLISIPQAAKLIGVHNETVYRWIRAGKFTTFSLGTTYKYLNKKQVQDFKERRDREGVVVFTVRRPIKKKSQES